MEGLIRIRPLTASDLDAVFAIQSASPEASQWSRDEYQRMLSRPGTACRAPTPALGRQHFTTSWGGERAGQLVGLLVARQVSEELEILNLAVAPAARRYGVGSQLLRHVLEEAKRDGARRAFLEVRESNQPAVAFYARHGFSLAGRRKQYYRDPPEDALILRANLD